MIEKKGAKQEVPAKSEKPQAQPQQRQLSNIERAKLSTALSDAVDNESLKSAFLALKNGNYVWEMFVSSVDAKIGELMNQPVAAKADALVAIEGALKSSRAHLQSIDRILSTIASDDIVMKILVAVYNQHNPSGKLSPESLVTQARASARGSYKQVQPAQAIMVSDPVPEQSEQDLETQIENSF